MAQFARPDGNVTQSGFTGGFTAIDEPVALDADFAYGANNTAAELEVSLSNVTDPASSSGHVVRYRVAKTNSGVVSGSGSSVVINCRLMQGATIIRDLTSQVATGTWTTYAETLSAAEADAITDYTDLRLEFTTNAAGGSPANRRGGAVSWAELEVPNAVVGVALVGSGAGVGASSAGPLALDLAVVGAAAGIGASSAGPLSLALSVVGSAAGIGDSSAGVLGIACPLVGSAAGVGESSGGPLDAAAGGAVDLAGSSDGISTSAGGVLGIAYGLLLSASSGVATAGAALAVAQALVGSAMGAGVASADILGLGRPLVGSTAGAGTTLGDLTIDAHSVVDLAGTSVGTSDSPAGPLRLARPLVGSVSGESLAAGNLARAYGLAMSQSDGIATASGTFEVTLTQLVGGSAGTSQASLVTRFINLTKRRAVLGNYWDVWGELPRRDWIKA